MTAAHCAAWPESTVRCDEVRSTNKITIAESWFQCAVNMFDKTKNVTRNMFLVSQNYETFLTCVQLT